MKKTLILFFVLLGIIPYTNAQWIWDMSKMTSVKTDINSLTYSSAYRSLLKDAERAMQKKPVSVTDKKPIPPSGDIHDYVSLSRYVWPDSTKADGLPYTHKDGQSNPELENYDRNPLGEMANAVNTLSLAYFFSGDERYAEKATEFLRVWFLNEKTRMNPNLNYAQFIPGLNDSKGRPTGLIDTYSFVDMLNSVIFLEKSKSYTQKDKDGLQRWFAEFTEWFESSEQGIGENNAKNNHGLAYDVQLATYFLFSGNEKGAKRVVEEFPTKRMFAQIEPDGKQPQELRRTLAFGYSEYNIRHMIDMFAIAKYLGKDLHKMESSDGRSFYKAVDYLSSFLGKDVSDFPYQQISGWEAKQQELCEDLYRIVDLDPSKQNYLALYKKYSKQKMSDRNRLLFGAPNAIDEVFSFTTHQYNYAFQCMDKALAMTDKKNLVNPRTVEKDGSLRMVSPRDWCSGFFPGALWYVYGYTKENEWKEKANKQSLLIEGEKMDRSTHDLGFKLFCSFGNGYKLTNDNHYKEVLLQSAETLSKRFNPKIGAIRSWDHHRDQWQFPVIIDNMMNLELLFWAAETSGNKKYYEIADKHAQTTLKNHFRNDYSSYHVVSYDTISGKVEKKQTHQGYSDPSAWARGQAWALYGFTLSYRYTNDADYLKLAEQVAKFIFSNPNMPADMIPYWDFNDPAIPNAPRDASAACIIASALYELSEYSVNKAQYTTWADTILSSLIDNYMAQEGTTQGFLLLHSTGNYPSSDEIDAPIVYADYYFLEALSRKKNIENNKALY